MFGFGAKKDKPAVIADPEAEPVKTPLYDINNEVVFHVMPTRFKKQNTEAKQAQKTGLVIILVATFLIFCLVLAFAWYFFIYSKKPSGQLNSALESQVENIATTSGNDSAADSAPLPVPAADEAKRLTTVTETATTSLAATTTETASSSGPISDNQATVIIASSTDTDNDGLTDAEELILSTNKDQADTDADGYSDLAEFEKGYNPSGAGKLGAKILGNFQNSNFSLSYPAAWQFTASGNDSVIFRTNDEQMIQISLQPNLALQSITDWYKEQFGNQDIAASQYINQVDLEGNALWQGIFSPNGLTVYLTNDKKQTIASINYDLGFSSKLNYRQLLLFMINSFDLKN